MKVIGALLIVFLPLVVKPQFQVQRVKDNPSIKAGCDTCNTFFAMNAQKPLNFIIPNVLNDYIRQDARLYESNGSNLPNVSKYFTLIGEFSLFLVPTYLTQENNLPVWPGKDKALTYGNLQFSVTQNNNIITNWTTVQSLAESEEYKATYAEKMEKEERLKDWKIYDAGKFQLKIDDSLVVLIRGEKDRQILQSIFIKRIKAKPVQFDFLKFSSSEVLQNILNKHASQDGLAGETTNAFEISDTEIALLKFRDFRVQNNELEYAFQSDTMKWLRLSVVPPSGGPMSQYSYLAIPRSAAGKTMKVLLRYRSQRESINVLTIHVASKEEKINPYTLAFVLGLVLILITGWYLFRLYRQKQVLKHLRLKSEEIESKLQLLSGQLNPHFLFNSLNSLQNLINRQDTDSANSYVSELAYFLRTIVDNGQKEYTSLKEELELEESYIRLEQKRIFFSYSVDNKCLRNLSEIEFPPALLQPVIENSIHHAFTKEISNPSIILAIDCSNSELTISVSDNGRGYDINEKGHGRGLSLVKKRIDLLNAKLNGLFINIEVSSQGSGTTTKFIFKNWL